ncbi:GTP-binding protein [Neobacillus sp. NRS-1170]|uniref:GTP-binding protein n=1 Tax=Neobacillus sp. NRS-1170 TaxID=3233898 RepID=UPI003D2663DF
MIPVYVLSGFLGSGKTTLLSNMLKYLMLNGKRPAVIMNEIGNVNLDRLLINDEVPVAEMLNGCNSPFKQRGKSLICPKLI